jgi:hypothetical protein
MKKRLTDEDFQWAAKEIGCSIAAIRAVDEVESRGEGFNKDGSPKILFEGHKFHKYTEGKFTGIEEYKDISYTRWTRKWYATGANSEIRQQKEYLRFERAANLDEAAAIKSTSWGRYQIMGFNYKLVGFDDIFTFYYTMGDNELEHLISFVEYIFSTNLQKSLINEDWETFARLYNGKANVRIYAPKMERAFKKHSNV